MSMTAIKMMVDNAQPAGNEWPDPDMSLVQADDTQPPAFDFDSLPSVWGTWCQETAEAYGCPVDYVAANLFVAASAWLGNARRISPSSDWMEPPHLWIACVGKPSEGKTPSQKPFTEVSKLLEREAEPEIKQLRAEYEKNLETTNAKIDAWKSEVKKAVKEGLPSPDQPYDAVLPDSPALPRIMICDATTQQIVNILKDNPKGLMLLRDELAGWIGSFDRYSGSGADRGFYLECWNGGSYSVDLVKNAGAPVRVPYASLAIMGGFQPDKLNEALSGADDGLGGRFGYVWPRPSPYRPLKQSDAASSVARFDLLADSARRLRGLQMAIKENGESKFITLPLDPNALALFETMRREAITKARNTRGIASGWHGKTPTRALRLALVIEFLTWAASPDRPEPLIVSADSMACAGAYLDYLEAMFERVVGGLAIGRAEADAADIARHIVATRPPTVNEREVYQTNGFSYLRDPQRRKEAFVVLENALWLRPHLDHHGTGRKRSDWKVNPKLMEGI
ncbi:MAG: DUF3987 domain-containing protein [Bdellovibrionales bacterium]